MTSSFRGPARVATRPKSAPATTRLGLTLATIIAATALPAQAQQPSMAGMPGMAADHAAAPTISGASPFPARAVVYFIDLKDGSRVPLKLHVRMGLAQMGIAPAGVDFPQTGHHHILIDAPLPPLDRPIPVDDNHIHLGGGETETDITLTPGPHTLQLLIGDKNHIPHNPPVASPVIHVVAAAPSTPSPPGTTVSLIGLRDGTAIPSPSTIYFGLSGMGVAPSSNTSPNTGHHHLLVDVPPPDPQDSVPTDAQHLNFADGATQTDLTLPSGKHTLQLVFTDGHDRMFDPPVMSPRITVKVRGRKHD